MSTLAHFDSRSPAGLLALQSLPRIGRATVLGAMLHGAKLEDLLERHGVRLTEAFAQAQIDLERYRDAGVELLTFFDERYPERLRELADPPPLIYVRGDVDVLARERLVALVGTREPTAFGMPRRQT
ncbi:MAG TPA: DNA-processing protein DprA [Solirubrobacteraceae bacterium]|jgi:DNA processing protein